MATKRIASVDDHVKWAKALRQAWATTVALQVALSNRYGKTKPVSRAADKLAARLSNTKSALDNLYFSHPEIKPFPNNPELFIYYGSESTKPTDVIVTIDDVDAIASHIVSIYKTAGEIWTEAMDKMPIASPAYRKICAFGESSTEMMNRYAFDCYEPEKGSGFPFPQVAYGWG